ncbi:MAG TPA: AAA family ATPase [Terriglobia bacterium]|nr:AAA family ATPase [Terriglobia bacterium]
MYKRFFGLNENPFNVNPDPRFLFQTREIEEALACLNYGVQRRRGFILLSGEVGTGKTTLLNKLLDQLRGERVTTAFIFNPRLGVNEFLHSVLADFGIACESYRKGEILRQLNQWLLERYRAGESAVLIVDEAQNLSLEVLEEIRLLTNLETSTEKLLQIVLSGQTELEFLLKQPALRQLRQRISLRCRMTPLTLRDTRGYVSERLRIAGAQGDPIFGPGALETVFRYSGGIPRVINLLCEHALITAFAEGEKPVLADTILAVAREFELDGPPKLIVPTQEAAKASAV